MSRTQTVTLEANINKINITNQKSLNKSHNKQKELPFFNYYVSFEKHSLSSQFLEIL